MATDKTERYWRLDDALMASANGIEIGALRNTEGVQPTNRCISNWLLNENAVIEGFSFQKPSIGSYNLWKNDGTRDKLIERIAALDNNTLIKFTGKPPKRKRGGDTFEASPTRTPILAAENFSGEVSLDSESECFEGAMSKVLVNRYERDPQARRVCLEKHGYRCSVCTFDFEKEYGDIGYGFIHVHHLTPLSSHKTEHSLNPVKDLVPVCPNCHAMLHSCNPPLLIEELREIWLQNRDCEPLE